MPAPGAGAVRTFNGASGDVLVLQAGKVRVLRCIDDGLLAQPGVHLGLPVRPGGFTRAERRVERAG